MTEQSTTGVNVSNDQLFATLLDIKNDLGELKAGHVAIQSGLGLGAGVSAGLAARVTHLELTHAKQEGALRIIKAIMGAMGAAIGLLATHFWGRPPQ